MKPPIQILCEKLRDSRGYAYNLQYYALKEHLKGLTDVEFLSEMLRVDNPDIFRYLQSVGLPYGWQQIAAKRAKELTE